MNFTVNPYSVEVYCVYGRQVLIKEGTVLSRRRNLSEMVDSPCTEEAKRSIMNEKHIHLCDMPFLKNESLHLLLEAKLTQSHLSSSVKV